MQGVRQIGTGLEAIGGDPHLGRQVFHQRLQFAAQLPVEVTAAVGFQAQGLQQVAVDLQCQRQGFRRRQQGQLAFGAKGPVAGGLQQTGQVQIQVIALYRHRVDLQTGRRPVRRQLQTLEFFAAVEQQAADLDLPQFDGQRQLELRERDRAAVWLFGTRRERQADLIGLQLLDAQSHARQAQRRPGKNHLAQLNPVVGLLPQHPVGTPLPAQPALEVFQGQPRNEAQRPAAARRRA
ncbi:hypothetical protein D3C87_1273910 [compost metagenome]